LRYVCAEMRMTAGVVGLSALVLALMVTADS
jgi:hypothetical protein